MSKVTGEAMEAFVQLFESSDWDEVDIKFDDFALHVSKTLETLARPPIRNDTVKHSEPVAAKSTPRVGP